MFAWSLFVCCCRLFENTILPESYRKPYLIYAYSDFCFHCMQVAPIWDQTQEDLEKIGRLVFLYVWFNMHQTNRTICIQVKLHFTWIQIVLLPFFHPCCPLENGGLSDWYRYWAYHIESYQLLFYRPILRASLQVQQLLTGPITQQIKGHSRPSPAARGCHSIHNTRERVGGAGGGRL